MVTIHNPNISTDDRSPHVDHKNDGDITVTETSGYLHVNPPVGLSKREYFAGLAMQGITSNSKLHQSLCIAAQEQARRYDKNLRSDQIVAACAVVYAETLIKLLEKK